MEGKSLSEEEFIKKIDVADKLINQHFVIRWYQENNYPTLYNYLIDVLNDDVEAGRIDQHVIALEEEFENLRLKYVKEILKIVFDDAYINTDDMEYEEEKKLYELAGFEDVKSDECIHLGFVRLANGFAFLYTYSELYDDSIDIEYIVRTKED
jgi:hypothetical protein